MSGETVSTDETTHTSGPTDGQLVPAPRSPEIGNWRSTAPTTTRRGHPQLTPREKRIQRAGQRFGREKLVPRALRALSDDIDSTDEKVRQRAYENVLDRFGFPRRKEFDIDGGMATLTHDLVLKAMEHAAHDVAQDPSRGAVIATDAEFEVVGGAAQGNGQTLQ